MNKLLKVMIIIAIIIIIILVALLFLSTINGDNNNNNENYEQINEDNSEIVGTKKIQKVTSRDDFFIIEKCIQKYMQYLQDKDIEKIYGCLDQEYINREKILKRDIQNQLNVWKKGDFIAQKIYEYDDTETISEYFVYGLLENNDYYIIVKVDYANETFSVLPNYYIKEETMENTNRIEIVEMK